MFFWWICGGESGLPILFLCHLSFSMMWFLTLFFYKLYTLYSQVRLICHFSFMYSTVMILMSIYWTNWWAFSPLLFSGRLYVRFEWSILDTLVEITYLVQTKHLYLAFSLWILNFGLILAWDFVFPFLHEIVLETGFF